MLRENVENKETLNDYRFFSEGEKKKAAGKKKMKIKIIHSRSLCYRAIFFENNKKF